MKLIEAAKAGRWKVAGASLTGEYEGVAFEGERRWWGGAWTIVGQSAFPVPESLILFVSEQGMDHGFWRDMLVGTHDLDGHRDAARARFDSRHFVFCDTPGLLRLVVGTATIQAFARTPVQPPIVLYVRDRVVRTRALHNAGEEQGIARHVAVHRALADDHARLVEAWQTRLAAATGRGSTTWPLTGQITSRVGTLLVAVTWELQPESRDGAEWEQGYHSLRTEVTAAGDRAKARWTLVEAAPGQRASHRIGDRMYLLEGTPHVPFDRLARIVEDAGLSLLGFGGTVRLAIPGLAAARQLTACRTLVETLLDARPASESPYR